MTRGGRGAAVCAIAVGALAMVWSIAPPATPPLYDSACVPVAYVWVSPPPGQTPDGAPASAAQDIPVAQGMQQADEIVTGAGDTAAAPQAQLIIDTGTVTPPPDATSVHAVITPEQPVTPPSGWVLDSNVYRFDVTGGGRSLTPTVPVTITLSTATTGAGTRTIERYDNGTWTPVTTVPVANCVSATSSYGASVKQFGEYAVLLKAGSPPPAPPPAGTDVPWAAILAVIAALFLTAAAYFSRRYSSRS